MTQDEFRPQASWVIGRAEGCDLQVPEPTVSSRHCLLTRQGDGFSLEDLGSSNGTYVDGVKLTPGEPVGLPAGANVTLGSHIQMPWPAAASPSRGRARTIDSSVPGTAMRGLKTANRAP